jgi:hypothetical protein
VGSLGLGLAGDMDPLSGCWQPPLSDAALGGEGLAEHLESSFNRCAARVCAWEERMSLVGSHVMRNGQGGENDDTWHTCTGDSPGCRSRAVRSTLSSIAVLFVIKISSGTSSMVSPGSMDRVATRPRQPCRTNEASMPCGTIPACMHQSLYSLLTMLFSTFRP